MSRFAWTTLLAIAAASIAAILLRGEARNWAVAAVWGGYLPIFVCGLVFIRLNYFCPAICRGFVGQKWIALTFDDGPDPQTTPPLLDLLAREKISATFFCIGKNVAAHPQVAARIIAEGHLIGNHSFRHPWYISLLWSGPLRQELESAQRAIEDACGVRPVYFRPPMGMTSPSFSKALRQTGLMMAGWDVRSLDTVLATPKIIERVVAKARGGSIILLHDGGAEREKLLEIVSAAISQLRERGFSFERLDRLAGQRPA